MKINEIIRERRLSKGLTQEEAASRLGVSASAVNKWEKAVSYPDITLLPALARLLDTDLNTLLSFQDDLTEKEIGDFLNSVVSAAAGQGIEQAFRLSMDKVREYPSRDSLVLNVGLTLEGLMLMSCEEETGHYLKAIEELYVRAAESKIPSVQNQARTMLISKYTGRKEYDKAENLLEEMPDGTAFDKRPLKANLAVARGDLGKAARLLEEKILSDTGAVQSSLFALMEVELKENRTAEAEAAAHAAKQLAELFDLWKGGVYVADLLLAVAQKDVSRCLDVLKLMLPSMQERWTPAKSPLYRHIPEKEDCGSLGEWIMPQIVSEFENPDNLEYDFLRGSMEIRALLDKFKSQTEGGR